MIIAFDIDGTLVKLDNTPNYGVIDYLRLFQRDHHRIIVWSGGGVEYAQHWVEKLGLKNVEVNIKSKDLGVDICFDDEFVDLAKVNIKVPYKK